MSLPFPSELLPAFRFAPSPPDWSELDSPTGWQRGWFVMMTAERRGAWLVLVLCYTGAVYVQQGDGPCPFTPGEYLDGIRPDVTVRFNGQNEQ